MSTIRLPKGKRSPRDFYETPAWVTRAFLEHPAVLKYILKEKPRFAEPCVGNAAIWREVFSTGRFDSKDADLIDIEPGPLALQHGARVADFLSDEFSSELLQSRSFCLTNPPFSLAMEFVQKALYLYSLTAMLLPLGFLASNKRHKFLRENPPTLYVLSERPKFTEGSPMFDCAWFVWAGFQSRPLEDEIADERVHFLRRVG